MLRWLLSLFDFEDTNKELKENIKKYETNREVHSNKNNQGRVKN